MNSLCVPMVYASFMPRLAGLSRCGGASTLLILCSGLSLTAWGQQLPEIPLELRDLTSTVSIRADFQEKAKETYHLRGHVEVTYQKMKLTADEASFDASMGDVVARGHVTFTDAQSRLEADEAHYNVRSGLGWFTNCRGNLHAHITPRPRMLITENPFYVRARKVERRGESTYVIEHGRLSSCECEEKGWSIGARRAQVEVGNKAVTQGSVFRLFRVPLFYSPYLVNSIARQPRQTGFLLPHVGNSSQKGFIVGGGFFWAINPSADLLLGVENYSIRGLARSGGFRARPSATSEITIDYFGVNDKGSGPLRQSRAPGQSLRAVGQARDLGHGFRGVLDVDYITSLAFRYTFTDNFTQAVASEVHQTGFLSKNFDAYSINMYASRYQNFLSAELKTGNSIIIRQTPSFSFSGIDKQVGQSPVYFAFDVSAAGMGRTEPGLEIPRLSERLDFHPEVTLRPKPFLGFHVTPTAGLRATRYGTSLRADRAPLDRLLGEFSVDLRPPSFDKVFSQPLWGYRFKHVIEPDVRYRLVRARNPESLQDVMLFDYVDIFAETNEIEYSLTNSLFFRKDTAAGQAEKPQARELISWRLSQKYYFDPTFGGALDPGKRVVFDPTISLTGFAFAQGRRLSPIVSVLKFAPFSHYDTELRADISPSGGGVQNAGITSHLRRGPVGLSFTDFFINRTAALSTPLAPTGSLSGLPSFHLLRAVASYGDVNRKGFSGAFGLDFNFAQRIAHQVVNQVSYNFGCFALDFEYRRFDLGSHQVVNQVSLRRENQFRVALSLANVGTFGNLKPRERLY
ncbi:MAG: LPS assembly protein LptD [Terriglobia bacterium]